MWSLLGYLAQASQSSASAIVARVYLVTDQSLVVRFATAGTELVGNAETDFTTQLAALSELLVVKTSLAH